MLRALAPPMAKCKYKHVSLGNIKMNINKRRVIHQKVLLSHYYFYISTIAE